MAKELNIEFLGSLPLDPLLTRCCDEGKNFLTEFPQSPTIFTLQTIVQSKFLYIFKNFVFIVLNCIELNILNIYFSFQK